MANKRVLVLGTVALVLLGIAVYIYASGRSGPPAPTSTVTLDGICLACKSAVTTTYRSKDGQPATCPKCGQRAVYGTSYCETCGIRFVAQLEPVAGGLPKLPMIPMCPKCNAAATSYRSYEPEQQQAKLGPLPKWPP